MAIEDQEYKLEHPLAITHKGEMELGVCEFLTVYFEHAYKAEIRDGVIASLQRYAELYGQHLRFSTDFPNKRWISYDPETVGRIIQHITNSASDEGWQFRVHGGKTKEEASYFKVQGLGFSDWESEQYGHLSYLKMQLPPGWIRDHPEDLADLFLFVCQKLSPVQGWGGLGFALPDDLNGRRRMEHLVYKIAHKFPLLEVEEPLFDQAELSRGIRGGNWLTAVGEPWLSKLGGIETLRRDLGESFTVVPYLNGAMIRAGDGYGVIDPLLRAKDPSKLTSREKELAIIPPHYRHLAYVLKPVRIKEFPAIHSCQYGPPCFDEQATLAWLKRFD